jgi:hypothetical protein
MLLVGFCLSEFITELGAEEVSNGAQFASALIDRRITGKIGASP